MEDQIYYHFILYGNSRVSYKEKMYYVVKLSLLDMVT